MFAHTISLASLMYSFCVSFEVTSLTELAPTDQTFMLPLSLMYGFCVSFQAASLFELAPADQTFKWPLTRVHPHMHCKLWFGRKLFAACWTLMRFYLFVFHVCLYTGKNWFETIGLLK